MLWYGVVMGCYERSIVPRVATMTSQCNAPLMFHRMRADLGETSCNHAATQTHDDCWPSIDWICVWFQCHLLHICVKSIHIYIYIYNYRVDTIFGCVQFNNGAGLCPSNTLLSKCLGKQRHTRTRYGKRLDHWVATSSQYSGASWLLG